MGEVYKARDLRLDRPVALKVLPPEVVRDPERVRRFVQEAKAASSLSHPHIVTIHEIGESVPSRAGSRETPGGAEPLHFIAMELVDGRTLRQLLAEGETGLERVVGWMAQAAEGLAKAHEAGIVHRDLKPENIMVSRDGFAKVLDFGLAKLTQGEPSRSQLAEAPTAYLEEKTKEGTVLGTVGYMSPEQVRGLPLDPRSDVFSLGCILYEAATGARPFRGESSIDVQHAILHDRPAPIETLAPKLPRSLQRLILRCLAKEPERRLQSMRDLALELREVVEEWEELIPVSGAASAVGSTVGSVPGLSGPAPARAAARPIRWLAIGLGGAILLAVFAWWLLRGRPEAPSSNQPSAFQSMRITPLTTSGKVEAAAISPDGKYLAYGEESAGKFSLRLLQVETGSDLEIAPPQEGGFRGLAFSPDANYLYYTHRDPESNYSTLYRVTTLGGAARKLLFDIDTAVSFSPDGRQVAFVRGYPPLGENALMVAEAGGAGERKLATRAEPRTYPVIAPAWSPDGASIAAAALEDGEDPVAVVAVRVADGRESPIGGARFADIITGLAWLPDGRGLVVAAPESQTSPSSQIWLLATASGELTRVTNDLNSYEGVTLTADGRSLATIQETERSNLWLVPIASPAGAKQLTFGAREHASEVQVLADGSLLLAAVRGNERGFWRGELGGEAFRSKLGAEADWWPSASGDGHHILFGSLREAGVPHVFRMDGDGGNVRQLTRGSGEIWAEVAPDGTWFLYRMLGPQGGLFRAPLEGEGSVRLVGPEFIDQATISPDGRQIAYEAYREHDGLQRQMLEVVPANGGAPVAVTAFEGAKYALSWTPDGQAVSYLEWRDGVGNLWRQPLDGGLPIQLTHFADGEIFAYDWVDADRVVLSRGETTRDAVLIEDFR